MSENQQHPDRDTRDLSHEPRSDFEDALDVVRRAIVTAYGLDNGRDQRGRLALIALDLVAAPGKALAQLESVPSWFTVPLKEGGVELNAQGAACERMFSVSGESLRECVNAAAHCVALRKRAEELEAGR